MPNPNPYGGFTIPERLQVDALSFDTDSVTILASTDDPAPRCPCCERPSRRGHGRYQPHSGRPPVVRNSGAPASPG